MNHNDNERPKITGVEDKFIVAPDRACDILTIPLTCPCCHEDFMVIGKYDSTQNTLTLEEVKKHV